MSRETEVSKLEKWCAEKGLFSKADLMRYGCDNYYLRAWRTGCDFVTQGKARKLSEKECKERNLTTSMGWYEWIGEQPDTEQESSLRRSHYLTEIAHNQTFLERGKQLIFIA